MWMVISSACFGQKHSSYSNYLCHTSNITAFKTINSGPYNFILKTLKMITIAAKSGPTQYMVQLGLLGKGFAIKISFGINPII